MFSKIILNLVIWSSVVVSGFSQVKSSDQILEDIKKLNVLGSVLYVAAHPDDENTRLISFLSKEKKYRTAYVSLTRGDGGQNLIGSQLDEYLGVIRTNELLEARKIDGGIQYFTRANDFGYSKNAEETFTIWNRDTILYDLVRLIREFKPDVIINRFDHRTSGRTHGHHTASAQLAVDAFKEASHALYRVQDMKDLEPILVSRIFFNTSIFFYGSKEKFDAADKSSMYSMDLGAYYPSLGLSNGEVSALSRSMHKSQGFGINSTRGTQMEYFERIGSKKDAGEVSPFDGLNLTWTRINGGGNVEKIISQVITEYDHNNPSNSIPLLQKAEQYIFELSPGQWRDIKLKDIRDIIVACAGIYADANTDKQIVSNGQRIKINTEFICRSKSNCVLQKIVFNPSKQDSTFHKTLDYNVPLIWSSEIGLLNLNNTSPFWLAYGRGKSIYRVDDKKMYAQAISDKELSVEFYYKLNGVDYIIRRDIIYKNDDPVLGEVRQALDVLPAVTVEPFDPSVLISTKAGSTIKLILRSRIPNQSGKISLRVPDHVSVSPQNIQFNLPNVNSTQEVEFRIQSQKFDNSITEIPVLFESENAFMHVQMKYPHIPWQNVLTPAVIKLTSLDLKTSTVKIGYINGAGDYIDEALKKLSYEVLEIASNQISSLDPAKIPILIFGIRAWNTREELPHYQTELMNYVKKGGRLIFQYNTTSELMLGNFLGDEFKISRDRVTNEESPVRILNPSHTLLNKPNKISLKDFDNWVQERGLYYPNVYSKDWEEILAMNDPNEKELNAGILYKKLGKGSIIYTPLSWFRQLPAGVPGAYRLFVNLIAN